MPELDEKTIQDLKSNIENASTSFSPQRCETWDERADEYAEMRDTCVTRFLECYARGLKDPADIKDYVGLVKSDGTKARGASPDVFKDLELFSPLELTKPPKWFTEPRKFPDWEYEKYCGTRIPPADINHSAKSVMDKILSSKDIGCLSTSMFIDESLPSFKKLEHDVIIGSGETLSCSKDLREYESLFDTIELSPRSDISDELYAEFDTFVRMPNGDIQECNVQPAELIFGTITRNKRVYDLDEILKIYDTCQGYYSPVGTYLQFDTFRQGDFFNISYVPLEQRFEKAMQFILENHSLHILDLLEPISINYHMEGHRNAAEVSNNQHEEEKRLRTKSLRSNGRI